MASFVNNVITTAGKQAIAAAIAGYPLTFTCIQMGSGYLPEGADIRATEQLYESKARVEITKCDRNGDDTAIIGGVFINSETGQGFYYREVGLFANDPMTGDEILFSYGNAGDYCEFIPSGGGQTTLEKQIDILTYVGDAAVVKIYIDSQGFAMAEDLEACCEVAHAAWDQSQVNWAWIQRIWDWLSQLWDELQKRTDDLQAQIDALQSGVTNDLTTNPWRLSFENLDGCDLKSGNWNEALARLEC